MSDLRFYLNGHLSVPEVAASIRNEGASMVGKMLTEILGDMTQEDINLALNKWTEYGVLEAIKNALQKD